MTTGLLSAKEGATAGGSTPNCAATSHRIWKGITVPSLPTTVHVDGTLKAPSTFGWALAGDPLGLGGESWDRNSRMGMLDLSTGAYAPTIVNLALPSNGPMWVIGLSYNGMQMTSGSAHLDSASYQGTNWFQMSQPELVYFSGATNDLDVIYLVYGAAGYIELKRGALNGTEYKAKNGAAGVIAYTAAVPHMGGGYDEPDLYTYTDQKGNTAVFFGPTGSGAAAWQLWKITDEAGNAAYVGDTDAKTATTAGYDGAGRIQVAYDAASSQHRFTYAYSTIDSVVRLTQVKAETKVSGTWASPSGRPERGDEHHRDHVLGEHDHQRRRDRFARHGDHHAPENQPLHRRWAQGDRVAAVLGRAGVNARIIGDEL